MIAILYHKIPGGIATTTSAIYYTHTDHLGSITHILDNQGSTANGLIEERSFDAWGRVRDPDTWIPYTSGNFPNWMFDRGYTGHEHIRLDNWNNNIINMNGRLYDPLIGRMFSPDPVITNNENTQDYNKYTYVRNNPLKYTDPSGYSPSVSGVHPIAEPEMTAGQGLISIGISIASSGLGDMVTSLLGNVSGMSNGARIVAGSMFGEVTGNVATKAFMGGDSRAIGNAALSGLINGFLAGIAQASIYGNYNPISTDEIATIIINGGDDLVYYDNTTGTSYRIYMDDEKGGVDIQVSTNTAFTGLSDPRVGQTLKTNYWNTDDRNDATPKDLIDLPNGGDFYDANNMRRIVSDGTHGQYENALLDHPRRSPRDVPYYLNFTTSFVGKDKTSGVRIPYKTFTWGFRSTNGRNIEVIGRKNIRFKKANGFHKDYINSLRSK